MINLIPTYSKCNKSFGMNSKKMSQYQLYIWWILKSRGWNRKQQSQLARNAWKVKLARWHSCHLVILRLKQFKQEIENTAGCLSSYRQKSLSLDRQFGSISVLPPLSPKFRLAAPKASRPYVSYSVKILHSLFT